MAASPEGERSPPRGRGLVRVGRVPVHAGRRLSPMGDGARYRRGCHSPPCGGTPPPDVRVIRPRVRATAPSVRATPPAVRAIATRVPATRTSARATPPRVPPARTSVRASAPRVPATPPCVRASAPCVPPTRTRVRVTRTCVPVTRTCVPVTLTCVPATLTDVRTSRPCVPPSGTEGRETRTDRAAQRVASEVLADLRQLEIRRRRRVLAFERYAEMVVELEGTELLQEQRQLGILVGAATQLDRKTDARDSAGPAVGLEAAHHLGADVHHVVAQPP